MVKQIQGKCAKVAILDSLEDLQRQQIFAKKAKQEPIGPILNMPLLYQPAHLFSGNVLSFISV